jgi:hypothetical protein
MSIVQKLTEGIVRRDMAAEGQALLDKWSATGLLEGIDTEQGKHNMARLLENQAKELLRESTTMTSNAVEGFAAVAFPIVRRVFAGLIANDLVSVQPMSLPSGLIFFLDFQFSPEIGTTTLSSRFGNAADKSIYGTDQVGSQITGGVDLVDARGGSVSGPRQQVGYAYASPTGSSSFLTGAVTPSTLIDLGSPSEADKKALQFDPDLLSLGSTYYAIELAVAKAGFSNADFDNLAAFEVTIAELNAQLNGSYSTSDTTQVRRLTKLDGTDVKLYFSTTISTAAANATTDGALDIEHPQLDQVDSAGGAKGAIVGFNYPLEGNENIPEIDIKVDQIAITAQTKKLKAKWTPELGQDLNAYHNLDAEVELTSILSEQIALEIDREILADLVNGAKAGTYYWSRSPGLFVDRTTGLELGATSAAPDFTGTVSEWYETLIETMNDVSAQIHRKTLRGGANFCVVSPEVANILEFTSGFRANVTADADKGLVGAVTAGSLSRKWDVIVDPYFPRGVVLMGRKGSSFLESGYVYAPYVPLQTTPTIFGPEDFVPRKGVMTRYAKKMVRPDMYGLVLVRGLVGEAGS